MDSDLICLKKYAESRDADAFAELVRTYSGMVFAAARRVTEDPHAAEDVTQSTFLALARNAARIRTSVAGWLHLTATNRALDAIRSRRRAEKHEHAAANQRRSEAASDASEEWMALGPLIDQAIAGLPARLRTPLVLHYLQSHSQEQVAAELGVNQSTVSRRLKLAIDQLRDSLKKGTVVGSAALSEFLSCCGPQAAPPTLQANLTKIGLSGYGRPSKHLMPKLLTSTAFVSVLIGVVIWKLQRPLAPTANSANSPPSQPTTAPAAVLSPLANDEMVRSIATSCDQSAAQLASVSYDFALDFDERIEGKESQTAVTGNIARDGRRWQMEYSQHDDPSVLNDHPDTMLNFTEHAFFSETEFGQWTVGTVNPNVYKHHDPTHLPQTEMEHVSLYLGYDMFPKAFRLFDRNREQPYDETALADIRNPNWHWQCNPITPTRCTLYGWPKSRPITQLPYLTAEYRQDCGFFTSLKFTMADGKLAKMIEITPAKIQGTGIWYPERIVETAYNLREPNMPYSTRTFQVTQVSVPMKPDPTAFTVAGMRLPKDVDVIVVDEKLEKINKQDR